MYVIGEMLYTHSMCMSVQTDIGTLTSVPMTSLPLAVYGRHDAVNIVDNTDQQI